MPPTQVLVLAKLALFSVTSWKSSREEHRDIIGVQQCNMCVLPLCNLVLEAISAQSAMSSAKASYEEPYCECLAGMHQFDSHVCGEVATVVTYEKWHDHVPGPASIAFKGNQLSGMCITKYDGTVFMFEPNCWGIMERSNGDPDLHEHERGNISNNGSTS